MKKKLVFAFIASFLAFGFYSQGPAIEWQKCLGGSDTDAAYCIDQTLDGGFIIAGDSKSINGDVIGYHAGAPSYLDYWVVKLDNNSNIQWQKCLGGTHADVAKSIKQTTDGGYIIIGYSSSVDGDVTGNNGAADYWIVKLSSNGSVLWEKSFGGYGIEYGWSIAQTNDGGYIIAGSTTSPQGDVSGHIFFQDYWIVKLDGFGNLIWQKCLGGNSDEHAEFILQTADGGYIIAGSTESNNTDVTGNHGLYDFWIVKTSNTGVIQWQKTLGGSGDDRASCIKETVDGGYIVAGYTNSADGDVTGHHGGSDYWIVKLDNNGSITWQKCMGGSGNDIARSITQSTDDGYLVVGKSQSVDGDVSSNNGSGDYWIVKLDGSGNLEWQKCYGGPGTDDAYSVKQTADGGYVIAGLSMLNGGDVSGHHGSSDFWIVKINESKISGYTFVDNNSNCTYDNNEIGKDAINLIINPGNIITQSVNGFWSLDSLPAGNYTITIDTTNLNWTPTCPITQSFTVTNTNGFTVGPNFGLISTNPCSDPDVSIYAPFLRRCFSNQLVYVSACNQSTATGILNASYVDVELDPLLTVNSATLPFTSQGNNVFRFQTGNLNPGQCVNFSISTTVSCNALLGQTLCMDANLFPVQSCALDTVPCDPIVNNGTGGTLNGFPQPCTLPWDQSSLSVDGWCANDSIYFTITNTGSPGGGDMECYSPMWITVDGVVTYTDSIMITGGQTITLVYPGDGATWILNAEQHPLHPGNSHPNAHVEACGDTSNWTPDIVDDFPQDDADPVVDIYCGVVTGSYDPNDKTGYPIGQTDQKYIQPNQQLQYVIRFQNTGTDTAFTVVIRDTLDFDLNIFTVTAGVSSHPYTFRMYGPRVLEWTFNNINLPDSTTDQEGSNGFVTFHVEQVPNLAPGTEITNDADIYFDFNDPITTNTTMHRIYEGFVSVLNIEDLTQEGKSLLVFPNPTSHSITIKGETNMNQSFQLFDQMGREVFKGKLTGTETEVNLSSLSKGMYLLKIEGNYQPAQIVKE